MVGFVIIIKLDDETAGEFRTVGTSDDPICGQGTPSNLTLGAERTAGALAEAAITGYLLNGYIPLSGQILQDFLRIFSVFIMPDTICGTGPTV